MFQPPTLDQWRQLYDLADRIKQIAPWEYMFEDELFGVRDPITGQDTFVSVMGQGGDHFAVGIYIGGEALAQFWALHEMDAEIAIEALLAIRQLQISFEDRDALEKDERAIIKQLGRKYRGKHTWPGFRSFRPGYLPWRIDADEAALLLRIFEQVIDVAVRAADDETLLEPPEDESYLMRIAQPQDGNLMWTDHYVKVAAPEPPEVIITLNTQMLTEAKSAPKRKGVEVEVDILTLPEPVLDDDGRPYFPSLAIIVDAKRGLVLGQGFIPMGANPLLTFTNAPQTLLAELTKWGWTPETVIVRHDFIKDILTPLTETFRWKIKVKSKLAKLDEAVEFMFSAMGMDADPFAELGRELMEQETPPAAQAVTHRRPGTDKPAVTGKTAKPASNAPGQILQLKITLKGAKPPIWRRVLAPDNLTLEQLHTVIQIAMGWGDGHLHEFEINGVSYGSTDDSGMLSEIRSDRKVKISQVITRGMKRFSYTYDFGDDWAHTIEIEKVLPAEPNGIYPICLAGKRACPPEDVGGVWGYAELLETLNDPDHPDFDQMLEWVGGDFDPEAFDIDEVNAQLRSIKRR